MIGREQGLVIPGASGFSAELGMANDIISDATHDQLDLIASGRFNGFQGKSGGDLLRQFSRDRLYFDLVRAARAVTEFYEDDHVFERQLAGSLFEELALAQLGSRQDLGGVVLSGLDLLSVMTTLHPRRKIINDGFGQIGIDGIYVPDGLLMRGDINGHMSVQGVLEVSLGKWSQKVNRDKQIRGHQFLLRDLGIQDPDQAPLIIITPRFDDQDDDGYNGFGHITVPVGKRAFLDEVFHYAYYKDRRLDGVTINQARQNFRSGDGVIANPASV